MLTVRTRSVGTVLVAPAPQAGLGGSIGLGLPPAVPVLPVHCLCHDATNNGLGQSWCGPVRALSERAWPQ